MQKKLGLLFKDAMNKAGNKVIMNKIDGAAVEEFVGQNVFDKWLDDKKEDIAKGFKLDREDSGDFSIPKLVKNKNDQEKCYAILLENYDYIKIWQRHM